jgi:asparagine synthase (glutamine-hydrolysing)
MISHIADECATSDERRFIHYVEEQVQRRSNYLRQDDYPFLTPMSDTSRISTINPYLTNAGYLNGLRPLMREKGARIRLSGVGGDELLHSVNDPMPELSELLVNGKFLSLFRRLKVWGTVLREPYGRLLWRKAVLPSLPLRLQGRLNNAKHLQVPDWMNRDFVARTNLRERVVSTPDIYGFRSPIGRDQSTGFLSVANSISLGHFPEAFDHEMSYPFLHRPLVEFLCAIPFEQLLRPGESRSLMRRSLKGVLPETILRRKGKGNPREIVGVMFERQWPRWRHLFDDPLVARYGFVELAGMREAIDRVRHGFVTEARPVISMLTLEVWLRIIEERTTSARRKSLKDTFKRDVVAA